jgi:two-component system, LytTR family, response regulator LytT
MKLLIIEDEILAAERLSILLKELKPEIIVLDILSSVEDSINWLNNNNTPELIFMDIQLSDGTSLEILEKVKINSPIVFITAYDQYALEAFNFLSVDYLVKPVSKDSLEATLQKLDQFSTIFDQPRTDELVLSLKGSQTIYRSRFLLKVGEKYFFKNVDEISYFYAEGKTVYLVSLNGSKYVMDYSLDKLESLIDPRYFFRLNRSTIARVDSIKELRSHTNGRLRVFLSAGPMSQETVVSRTRAINFKEWAEL